MEKTEQKNTQNEAKVYFAEKIKKKRLLSVIILGKTLWLRSFQ